MAQDKPHNQENLDLDTEDDAADGVDAGEVDAPEGLDQGPSRILVDLVASEDDLATRLAAAIADVSALSTEELPPEVAKRLEDLKQRLAPDDDDADEDDDDWLEDALEDMSSEARITLAQELVSIVVALMASERQGR